jgi:hypothetical protein
LGKQALELCQSEKVDRRSVIGRDLGVDDVGQKLVAAAEAAAHERLGTGNPAAAEFTSHRVLRECVGDRASVESDRLSWAQS